VLDMEEFYKHRRQQKLLEKIRDEAQRNFDPRSEAEIIREREQRKIKQRMENLDKNDPKYKAFNSNLKAKNFFLWIKQTWLPKSKFRNFFFVALLVGGLALISVGPVYVYGQVNALLSGSDEVYWETKGYKNPIVGNPEKAERKDWVFQDTPRERFLRVLGFGSDWMTQRPMEERLKFWDWPWEDWIMYDLNPTSYRHREFDIPTSYITNPQFKNAQICPDCWRMVLYSCVFMTAMLVTSTFKWFPIFAGFIATIQLGWGNTGNDPVSYFLATLFGLPDFITGNKQNLSSTPRKIDYLRSIESGDFTDKNWLVWKYSFQRRKTIPKLDRFLYTGLWSKAVMAGERHKYEMEIEHYIYSMAEIDEHVRNMEPEMRRAVNADDWEYGRDYPLVECINMINSRALTDKKYSKGRRGEKILKTTSSDSGISTETTEEREIDIFMKSLEAKFQEAEAKKSEIIFV